MTATSKPEAARQWQLRGVPVFACAPGSKKPLEGSAGFKDATLDFAKVDALWNEDPARNVAIYPGAAGLCVVDTDPPDGEANFQELERVHGPVKTFTVRTPRGGFHRYYRGHLPGTAGRLGPGIDTRGDDSYVLVPPSMVDGNVYTVEFAGDIQPLPRWIADLCRPKARQDSGARVDLDKPHNVKSARAWLDRQPVWDFGSRNQTMTSETGMLMACGLSPEKAKELMLLHNEGQPDPLPDHEIEGCGVLKLEDYDTPFAEDARADPVATFANNPAVLAAAAQVAKPEARTPGRRAIVLRDWATQETRPPPSYQVAGFLPDRSVTAIYGKFQSFKSFDAQDLALASAAPDGRAFGHLRVLRHGPTVYTAGEGLAGVETDRRRAWCIGRGLDPSAPLPFYTVEGVPRAADPASVQEYIDAMKRLSVPPVLVVIDTLSRSMAGLNENEAGDATQFLDMAEELKRELDCAVVVVAHEGKDAGKELRGSSVFGGGFDAIWRAEHVDHGDLSVVLTNEKMKDFELEKPIHLQGREIILGDRKSVVFDWQDPADFKAGGHQKVVTLAAVRLALEHLRATDIEPVKTWVLAAELSGAGASDELIEAKTKSLQRGAKMAFSSYVAHQGRGGSDPTMWGLPTLNIKGVHG